MLENLQLFWDFFFYPLMNIDQMGMVSDVISLCIIVFVLFEFIYMVFEWSTSFTMKS